MPCETQRRGPASTELAQSPIAALQRGDIRIARRDMVSARYKRKPRMERPPAHLWRGQAGVARGCALHSAGVACGCLICVHASNAVPPGSLSSGVGRALSTSPCGRSHLWHPTRQVAQEGGERGGGGCSCGAKHLLCQLADPRAVRRVEALIGRVEVEPTHSSRVVTGLERQHLA